MITLNGKSKIPPTILNITSIVKPSILKGMRMTQANRNRKNTIIARGQHITNRMQRSKKAITVFMCLYFLDFQVAQKYDPVVPLRVPNLLRPCLSQAGLPGS